jgi:hypothetical protein
MNSNLGRCCNDVAAHFNRARNQDLGNLSTDLNLDRDSLPTTTPRLVRPPSDPMSSSTTEPDREVAASILAFVSTGAYPSADAVISAPLAASALPALASAIDHAEAELKVRPPPERPFSHPC